MSQAFRVAPALAALAIDREVHGSFPVVVTPRHPGVSLAASMEGRQSQLLAELERHGAVLLRGFGVEGIDGFAAVAASFGRPLLSYDFASTPRSAIGAGVYTSTEYPPHQHIPLHNEQSYASSWPMKIWFYCVTAAVEGGETPIADSRLVYQRIDRGLREAFSSRKLLYVRNYGTGFDLSWQEVFGTTDRSVVDAYCAARGIERTWKNDGELRTRQICQAVATHPTTGELVWFNQAHLFHVSNLEADVREALLEIGGEEGLPRNVYYGDGAPIEAAALAEIRGVLDEAKVAFPWNDGDVLMLDNMLAAHGRAPYRGKRHVAVAMAEPHGAE